MPRFIRNIRGGSDLGIEKRFEPALAAVDSGRAVIADRAAALEQTHLRNATREQERLAYKYGPEAAPAVAAAARVREAERRVTALGLEVERARTPVVTVDPQGVVIHGRVLDAARQPQADLSVAIIGTAGRAVARTATDKRGYFQLAAKPFLDMTGAAPATPGSASPAAPLAAADATTVAAPGAAPRVNVKRAAAKADASEAAAPATPSRATRLVVSDGKRELYSEDLATLDAGQSRYREIVLPADR